MTTLSILQAEWQLGTLRSEDVPAEAVRIMETGQETPAIIQLAGLIHPDRSEVDAVVQRAFAEAHLPPVPDTAARWRMVYHIARAIVEHRVTPLEGATKLWHLATDLELPREISHFAYLAADYGEGPLAPEVEREWFDAQIFEAAAEVLRGERPDQPPAPQSEQPG